MQELLEPVNRTNGTTTRMVHIVWNDNPNVALCGAPVWEDVTDETEVDCVVCQDIFNNS